MGPYCKFCDTRCFAYLPSNTPDHFTKIMRKKLPFIIITVLATCEEGQSHDKSVFGFSYDDIVEASYPAEEV